ncbi:ptrA, partial [Symbiodinium sp. CCMP2456]
MSDGMSSRLFSEVREKRGLCYTVYAACNSLRTQGAILAYAGTSTERAQETLDVMLEQFNELPKGVRQDELNRLKARFKSGIIMQQESSSSRASSLAADWYHLGRIRTMSELEAILDGISVETINAYLSNNPPKNFRVTTIGAKRLEVNPNAYSLATAFFVKTGSRDETPEVAGVSHFLEHMVFKGTSRRTAEDVNRELDELGAQSNAFTSEEQTVYYAVVLPELQHQIVDLLADIMRPTLRQEDFDTEKKVILEEIMKYDDQPPYGGHEKSMAAWFGEHPLGNSVLGTQDSVGNLTQQQMMSYFEQRYSPTNMTLVASGNVDFDALVEQANELCGSWKKYSVNRNT